MAIPGNLLNANREGSTTSIGISANGTNTTATWDQVVYLTAPGCFKGVAIAAGSVEGRTAYGLGDVTVPAGAALVVSAFTDTAGTYAMSAVINWISSGGTNISQSVAACSEVSGSQVSGSASSVWRKWQTEPVTSPVGTVDAQVIWVVSGLDAGEVARLDERYFGPPPVSNQAPTAIAGADQSVTAGATVTLSGSGTDSDGTVASYTWTLPTRPAGSAAVLSGSGASRTFVADVAGTYTASLVVTDDDGATSTPDLVSVTAAAVATAGRPRLGSHPVTETIGAHPVLRQYLGAALIDEADSPTSQYVVQNTQTGTAAFQWEQAGSWSRGAADDYTNAVGATSTLDFTAARVVVFGAKEPNGGVLSVSLDGTATLVDLYSPSRVEGAVLFDSGTVTDTAHTLVLTCTGDRNAAAGGWYVNYDRAVLDITGAAPVIAPPVDPGVGGRNGSINLHPFRGSWTAGAADGAWSIWNTPIGSGAQLVSAGLRKSTANSGKIYQDQVHIGYPGDPIKTYSAAVKPDGTRYEQREPWKSGGTAQVRVTANDSGPGAYTGGNHLSWFPLSTDSTRGWHGHPLGLTAGGNPTVRYVDPHQAPDDLYGTGSYGAHGGSHMSGLGCIRQWEWDSLDEAVIQHAIGLNTWGELYLSTSTGGKRWPANSTDSYYLSGYKGTNTAMKMGTLLTLPADYNWQGIGNLQARKVVRALWAFGFYIVDDAKWDVHQLSAERTISLSAQDFAAFHTPIQDALVASLVVDNNSPTSVGGGGTPRVALVPDVTRP